MPSDPLIGQRLNNFRVERVIGRGGMGMTYYGVDINLQRPVAIKVLDARFRDNAAYTKRFLQEAQMIARWRHENIVQIYYADEQDGLYYFVMEYIEGRDLGVMLSDVIARGELLPHDEVIRIGRSIAAALDYAHEQGIIHRDVKPSNVLIAENGRVVLVDFGLAMDLARGSLGEVFGSAHYIAPEQARRSADAVPESDLYSLGVMLYEMLTGVVPFDDPSPTSVALQHITLEVPSPRSLNAEINRQTEQVLLRALNKDPQQRYPNGAALMDALDKALHTTQETDQAPVSLPLPPAETAATFTPQQHREDPLIGQQLDEYRLESLLGRGGMARVYRAVDTRLKRYAAIKVIDAPFRENSDYIRRFEREAQAIAQLEHPNIVRLYRYGQVDELLYMALQYIEGTDLHDVLRSYRQSGEFIAPADALRIVTEICDALDYMHRNGVIHRDLTPANVMIDQHNHVFITDFGLSLLVETGTQGEIFGSPYYIAPEQAISSKGAVPQSDLYAVGVMLYEMFTGQLPFTASDPMEIALLQMTEPPIPPSRIRPEISPEVEAVILKLLSKKPEERYQSGEELVSALREALQNSSGAVSLATQPVHSLSEQVATRIAPLPTIPAINGGPPQKHKPRKWLTCFSIFLLAIVTLGGWLLFVEHTIPLAIPFSSGGAAATLPAAASRTPRVSPSPIAGLPAAVQPVSTATQMPSVSSTPTRTAAPATTTTKPRTPSPTATKDNTPAPTPTDTPPPSPTPFIQTMRQQDQMPMVLIPGGSFMMGAADSDPRARMDERPAHRVTLNAFYMDEHEVTVAQYAAFLTTLGSHVNTCLGYTCAHTRFETWASNIIMGTIYEADPGFEDYPANNISWFGAQAYCEWVGGRLPTEAEWEYAARGPDANLYPWGSEDPSDELAVFAQADFAALKPVTALPDGISYFGIYGMAGGVREWVADWYDSHYYDHSPTINPTGPQDGYLLRSPRSIRGGSWLSRAVELRSSARQFALPLKFDEFGPDTGFRCVVDVEE